MPVRMTGVSTARSMEVRQVAEPTAISPVRVSAMRMDQVALAGVAVMDSARDERAAEKMVELGVRIKKGYQTGVWYPRRIW